MQIKGKYVATIELNFNGDENLEGLLPFEILKEIVTGGELDMTIFTMVANKFGDLASVELKRQYADLYRIEDEGDGRCLT